MSLSADRVSATAGPTRRGRRRWASRRGRSRRRRRMLGALGVLVTLAVLGYVGAIQLREAGSPSGDRGAKEGEVPATKQARLAVLASPDPPPTPTEPEIPAEGTGRFAVAAGTSPRAGTGTVVRYTVEVETSLPFDPHNVSAVVDATLADPRAGPRPATTRSSAPRVMPTYACCSLRQPPRTPCARRCRLAVRSPAATASWWSSTPRGGHSAPRATATIWMRTGSTPSIMR